MHGERPVWTAFSAISLRFMVLIFHFWLYEKGRPAFGMLPHRPQCRWQLKPALLHHNAVSGPDRFQYSPVDKISLRHSDWI